VIKLEFAKIDLVFALLKPLHEITFCDTSLSVITQGREGKAVQMQDFPM